MMGAAFQNLQFHRLVDSENKPMCPRGGAWVNGRKRGRRLRCENLSYKIISHWHVMNSTGNVVNNI